jgi:hypothetical protein
MMSICLSISGTRAVRSCPKSEQRTNHCPPPEPTISRSVFRLSAVLSLQ